MYAARSFVRREPFVVCMGDHAISAALVDRLMAGSWDGCVLCVDAAAWHPSQINDATRVWLDDRGYVGQIGKELTVWNAIDTGVFQMTRDVFPAVEHLMHRRGHEVTITEVVRLMGERGRPFATCDVSGAFWADVDTPEDYESVAGLLREKYGERV